MEEQKTITIRISDPEVKEKFNKIQEFLRKSSYNEKYGKSATVRYAILVASRHLESEIKDLEKLKSK